MVPTRNNVGIAHEIGSIEGPHGHLKRLRRTQQLHLRARRHAADGATRDGRADDAPCGFTGLQRGAPPLCWADAVLLKSIASSCAGGAMVPRFDGPEGKAKLAVALARQHLFRNIPDIVQRLADVANAMEYPAGCTIYEEGETAAEINLYCVISGAMDVVIEGRVAGEVTEDEAFGEFPVVNPGLPYTVTVRARMRSLVALIPYAPFTSVAKEYPEVWKNMIDTLTRRLRSTYGRIPKARPPCVFIGHGHSPVWKEVEGFLQNKLHLRTVEFDSESRAGELIVSILDKMLAEATFAVVVLTAEDETAQGAKRARQNVIHEAGLFQGRLGFPRAILLVQRGVEEFSNVDGLQCLKFEGDSIAGTFDELKGALMREEQLRA
jgi:CRP-like cAMP-binding protein